MPTEKPASTPTTYPTVTPDRWFETIHEFRRETLLGWFPEIIVNNPSDFWIFEYEQILHFQEGINDIQIPIDNLAGRVRAFEISPEKTIWLFDIGEWPRQGSRIRLLEIDEHGTLLTEHRLPTAILVDASGNYIEDAPELWWEPGGSLIVGGDNYFYQLLDKTGNLNVLRRRGYRTDSHEYKVLNYFGTQDKPAQISLDGRTIPIVPNGDALVLRSGSGWGFLGAHPNGDFYVQVYEYDRAGNRITYQRSAVRKYDMEGNLVEELALLERNIPSWDSDSLGLKFIEPIAIMGRDGQLYAFLPGNKNAAGWLVRILID